MKIIAINGSPLGKNSVTNILVEEFFKGAEKHGAETKQIFLSNMNIHHCMGCFSCWIKTPGVCIFNDDMKKINIKDCDILIFASPVYVDNITGLLKNFMDRTIYLVSPYMEKDINNEAVHINEDKEREPKIMVISNCGYPGLTHFDVLKVLFRRLARNMQTELIAEIYRDEGPLFHQKNPQLEEVIENYKKLLRKAGEEIAQNLTISNKTKEELEKPLIPYDLYYENHNKNCERCAN
ncbi:MAG: flavodoxin family protein [Chlamydiae bacterium]|nr:flavodoxin family protein [Chlamydiota bacterium]